MLTNILIQILVYGFTARTPLHLPQQIKSLFLSSWMRSEQADTAPLFVFN